MRVATPAQARILVTGDSSEEGAEEVRVVWGQEIEVECGLVTPGDPAPSLRLSLNGSHASSEASLNEVARLKYFPTLHESGSRFSNSVRRTIPIKSIFNYSRFICDWTQTGPKGEALYSGSEKSRPLSVVMGPSLLLEMETELTYSEGRRIVPQFMSRPVPRAEAVRWYVLTENQTTLDLRETSEAGIGDLVPGEVRPVSSGNPDEWEVELRLSNLTENMTIWLHVENSVSFMDKMFSGTALIIIPYALSL